MATTWRYSAHLGVGNPADSLTFTSTPSVEFTLTDMVLTSEADLNVTIQGGSGGSTLGTWVVRPEAPVLLSALTNGPQAGVGNTSGSGLFNIVVQGRVWPDSNSYSGSPQVNVFFAGTTP